VKSLSIPVLFVLTLAASAQNIVWQKSFLRGQIFSTPRCEDLNGDGVKDVVIGAGIEMDSSYNGVLALDGLDGSLLWRVPSTDQMFASPVFTDLNLDGKKDVITGGRLANLMAIDGSNGQVIWEFFHCSNILSCQEDTLLHFFTPVVIPDINNDSISELLVTHGGYSQAGAGDSIRPNGFLIVVDGATGDSIISFPTPDFRETYCSPVMADIDNDGQQEIFFGTGGETVRGSLWMISLSDVLQRNPQFTRIVTSSTKGFFAPVSLADFNADNVLDIVSMGFDGTLYIINGADRLVMRQRHFPGNESASQPCIGFFNTDNVPDIGVVLYDGVFPNYLTFHKYVLDGTSLQSIYSKSEGDFSYHSLLAADINNDLIDEVIITNHFNDSILPNQFSIYAYDFVNHDSITFFHSDTAYNYACTPTFNDFDNDGFLDLVFSHSDLLQTAAKQFYITRFATDISSAKAMSWGEYMGTNRNSVFDNRNFSTVSEIEIIPVYLIASGKNIFGFKTEKFLEVEEILIFNAEGKLLQRHEHPDLSTLSINLNGYSASIYLGSVITRRNVISFKLPVY